MPIRLATKNDLPALYELGLQTPEIQVSANEPFMDRDEFLGSLDRTENFFLIDEVDGQIAGFLMANTRDQDVAYAHKYACIVYLVVKTEFRGHGLAKELYSEAEKLLKERGMTHIYCWANLESGIIPFMEKQGFQKGHQYIWMDKKL
ncbi:GNAT family N-acetyltransferase [Candidatus Peregrinibacteria bacterium]|nr:GNAT family N-acetyltransferase [Candidatus Peregrinibacteria bacterium]